MRGKTEEIERLTFGLDELGQRVPLVEKNVQAILSLAYASKSGISTLAEIIDPETR